MIRALARRLNDFKLRDKMLLSFLFFMVLPQLLLGFLIVREFREATLKEALAQAEEAVTRIQRQTLEVLEVGLNISERLAVDRHLEVLLTTRYASTLDVFRAYRDFDTFRLYQDISPEVTGIQAYVDNPSILDNWEVRPLTASVRQSFWFDAARKHPNANGWFSWRDPTKSNLARLSLVRYLTYGAEGNVGALVIDLNTTRIETLLGQEGFETLVLDPNRVVVASNRPGLAGQTLVDPRLLALISPGTGGTFEKQDDGQRSRVFLRDLAPTNAFNGLKIVCIVSPGVILRLADRMSSLGLIVIGAGSLISLLFLWGIYTLFARRLETLSRQLPLVAAGDFDQRLAVDGKDEIGQLAARFNSMVKDVRSLMAEVKESHEVQNRLERAQGQIQLKMLASQINPHFLFNVLESIRMKAHLGGQGEIASTVKLLGKLMRRNLEASGGSIPLGEELDNVKCYLDIEKFRLEEKLDYRFDLGTGVKSIPVPPLIVEPLVENAVVHGLERHYGGGKVTVAAHRSGDVLQISVADNGQGMPDSLCRGLLAGPEGKHVGLRNIHQRLMLTYGDEFGLTIESSEGLGTRVWFRIPLSPETP